jgi:hypothetical protein
LPQSLLLTTIKDETEKLQYRAPLPGPVFEPGPGWGFYIKRWFKKYFFKAVLPALIIIGVIGIFAAHKETKNEKTATSEKATGNQKITITIIKGDSRALLARKALSEYLKENQEETLSNGQKLFIEETLRRKLNNPKLIIGEFVEFNVKDIEEAITQAKQLTQFQLQKWEELAKKSDFRF